MRRSKVHHLALSSNGLGRFPFTEEMVVRICLGSQKEKKRLWMLYNSNADVQQIAQVLHSPAYNDSLLQKNLVGKGTFSQSYDVLL